MIIAIDGPVAAGKGTLARRLAAHLGYAYLDTGMIYRAVAAITLAAGADPGDLDAATAVAKALTPEDLKRSDLRAEAVGEGASRASALMPVRAALLDFQRRFATHPPGGVLGAVLDGRDIGTVVCPGAAVKLFITATDEARAARRHKELLERGEESIYARVLQDLQVRDARDSERPIAPLKPADDAIVLDTTEMDADEVFQTALQEVSKHRPAP